MYQLCGIEALRETSEFIYVSFVFGCLQQSVVAAAEAEMHLTLFIQHRAVANVESRVSFYNNIPQQIIEWGRRAQLFVWHNALQGKLLMGMPVHKIL
jgi:hypothetical protein